jgi:ribA/ribD-fused uncharacterized protein
MEEKSPIRVGWVPTQHLNETSEYERERVVWFRKTREEWGELSNMHGGFPLTIHEIRIYTSEHLYQACKLPIRPDVQREILNAASPMRAKMITKKHKSDWRADWERINVDLMRWCVRLKYAQHCKTLSVVIAATGDRPIVEDSHRDQFWGAVPTKGAPDRLVGRNVLGKIWMEVRQEMSGLTGAPLGVPPTPPSVPNLLLLGEPIKVGS